MLDIDSIKRDLKPLGEAYGLKRIYLFGSYAKGCADENSDIDLLIEKGKPLSLLMLSGFRQEAEELLKLSVDLVTTTGIDDKFMKMISGSEVLLYEEQR